MENVPLCRHNPVDAALRLEVDVTNTWRITQNIVTLITDGVVKPMHTKMLKQMIDMIGTQNLVKVRQSNFQLKIIKKFILAVHQKQYQMA